MPCSVCLLDNRPLALVPLSKIVTSWPRSISNLAANRPERPPPITPTFNFLKFVGAVVQSSYFSISIRSRCLEVGLLRILPMVGPGGSNGLSNRPKHQCIPAIELASLPSNAYRLFSSKARAIASSGFAR